MHASLASLGSKDLAGLAVRAALASPFLVSGLLKLSHWPTAVAEFSSLGIWFPEASLAATILAQLSGSLLLLTTRGAWLGAAALAAFTMLATIIAHPFWSFDGPQQLSQLMTFLEHVALTGGLIAAAILSTGATRPDGSDVRGRPAAGIAAPPAN